MNNFSDARTCNKIDNVLLLTKIFSRWCVGLLDVKPGFEPLKTKYKRYLFGISSQQISAKNSQSK